MRKPMCKYCQCCVSPLSKLYIHWPTCFSTKFKFSSSPEVTEAELMGKPGYPRCSSSSIWRCGLEPDIENPPKMVAVWRVCWQVLSERTGGSSGNDMFRPLHLNTPLTPTLSRFSAGSSENQPGWMPALPQGSSAVWIDSWGKGSWREFFPASSKHSEDLGISESRGTPMKYQGV